MEFKNLTIPVLVLITLAMSSCYYDNEEELYAEYYASQTCDTVSVSYNDMIRPIIESTCNTTGCHVAGGTGNGIFTNYAGLKAKVDNGSVYDRVVVQRNMPPNTRLNDCQINLIDAWINQGALEN